MKLSILIPAYNERYYIKELIRRVLEVPLPYELEKEIIVVDDCSKDGTREIVAEIGRSNEIIKTVFQEKNQGKGAAIRRAIEEATGDFCIFQDSDLEYDPNDYSKIVKPMIEGVADVVYGSRFLVSERRRVLFFKHSIGNRVLTILSNYFTDLYLTDMETCYKAFRTELLKTIPLRCNRFGLEPEITAKVAKRSFRLYEVPISYDGRTYEEGKKITWKDGVKALFVIVKYWIIDDCYKDRPGHGVLESFAGAHNFNRWLTDIIRPYTGNRVLEIGAGMGNITQKLMPREKYIVSDNDPVHVKTLENLAISRPWLSVKKIDATRPDDFADIKEKVDTVVCINVLEHIKEEDIVLDNFKTALVKGGRLILLVPQGQWLYSPLDDAVGHLKRYSQDELTALLRKSGFEIEKLIIFNKIGLPGWIFNGLIFRRKKMSKFQLKIYDSFVFIWRRVDAFLPWPGLSIIAIAKKQG